MKKIILLTAIAMLSVTARSHTPVPSEQNALAPYPTVTESASPAAQASAKITVRFNAHGATNRYITVRQNYLLVGVIYSGETFSVQADTEFEATLNDPTGLLGWDLSPGINSRSGEDIAQRYITVSAAAPFPTLDLIFKSNWP